jgi:predicted O-methyltransferase YrrM
VSAKALSDAPLVVWQAAVRRFLGRRPVLPWIPYPAIRRLAHIIRPEWRALETGSGNSTLWLARRVAYLRSVEEDPRWYAHIRAALPNNVDYQCVDLDEAPDRYCALQEAEGATYQLVIVDGAQRDQCMRTALRAVSPGGWIYLDNLDTAGRDAFTILRQATLERRGTIEIFTGFPPAQPTVTTGALAHF